MPDYRFTVKNSRGRVSRGVLVADSETDARHLLLSRGFEIVTLQPITGLLARLNTWVARIRPVSLLELAVTTRQLATLLNAGVGIRRSLDVLNDQGLGSRLSNAWGDVALKVQKGQSLSRAMSRHPDVFDGLYRGLVKAGESSGSLVANLDRLAQVLEREVKLRHKIKAAMTYPALVFVVCLGATFLLTQKVLPTFINGIFKDTAMELPFMTKTVIWATQLLNSAFFYYAVIPGTLIGGYLLAAYVRTPGGLYRFQLMAYNLPYLRVVLKKAACSRFCRTMGALLTCGVPVIFSLELTDMVLNNFLLSRYLQDVRRGIEDGERLSERLREIPMFPPLLASFTELGEQTGHLPKLYARLADMFDEELELALDTATAVMEPLLIGVLGGLVGYIVIAMFIPLYQILTAL